MAVYIFNDLSIVDRYFNDYVSLSKTIGEIIAFYNSCRKNNQTVYIYRDKLTDIIVCGIPFRKAIQDTRNISVDKRIQIMTIIDRSSPALPEDSAVPAGLKFFYDNSEIPVTGLAECAYLQMMGEEIFSYSLSGSFFNITPLTVAIRQARTESKEAIINYFSLDALKKDLILQTPIASWDMLVEHVKNNFAWLEITDDAIKALKRDSFERVLADGILKRLDVLNKLAGAESEQNFFALYSKYCQGDKAWFSDESDTRIRNYRQELTFNIHGVDTVCSFHGKVPHRYFRIHISSNPARGKKIYIAYIGRKIV